jgi:hypothetical protein
MGRTYGQINTAIIYSSATGTKLVLNKTKYIIFKIKAKNADTAVAMAKLFNDDINNKIKFY